MTDASNMRATEKLICNARNDSCMVSAGYSTTSIPKNTAQRRDRVIHETIVAADQPLISKDNIKSTCQNTKESGSSANAIACGASVSGRNSRKGTGLSAPAQKKRPCRENKDNMSHSSMLPPS